MPAYSCPNFEKFSFSNSQQTIYVENRWNILYSNTVYKIGEVRVWASYSYYLYQTHFFLPLSPGWFYDWTQTYDIAFFFSGFCVLLGGFILLLASLPPWETRHKQLPKPAPAAFVYKVASNV